MCRLIISHEAFVVICHGSHRQRTHHHSRIIMTMMFTDMRRFLCARLSVPRPLQVRTGWVLTTVLQAGAPMIRALQMWKLRPSKVKLSVCPTAMK